MQAQTLVGVIALAISPLDATNERPNAITGVWQTKSNNYVHTYQKGNLHLGAEFGDIEDKPGQFQDGVACRYMLVRHNPDLALPPRRPNVHQDQLPGSLASKPGAG